jgi:hypothetical protein
MTGAVKVAGKAILSKMEEGFSINPTERAKPAGYTWVV